MGDELKPCPFCGQIKETLTDATRVLGVWRLIHRCKVIGPILIERSTPEMVAEVWNTRADLAATRIAELTARAETAEARLEATGHVNANLREWVADARATLELVNVQFTKVVAPKGSYEAAKEAVRATLARIGQPPAQEDAK